MKKKNHFFVGAYTKVYNPNAAYKYGRLQVKVSPNVMQPICQPGGTAVVCISIKYHRNTNSAPKLVTKSPHFVPKKNFPAPQLLGDREYSFQTTVKCLTGQQTLNVGALCVYKNILISIDLRVLLLSTLLKGLINKEWVKKKIGKIFKF